MSKLLYYDVEDEVVIVAHPRSSNCLNLTFSLRASDRHALVLECKKYLSRGNSIAPGVSEHQKINNDRPCFDADYLDTFGVRDIQQLSHVGDKGCFKGVARVCIIDQTTFVSSTRLAKNTGDSLRIRRSIGTFHIS